MELDYTLHKTNIVIKAEVTSDTRVGANLSEYDDLGLGDDFIDYDQDVINNTFNHIKVLGREKTYHMYKNNISIWRRFLNNFKQGIYRM